MKQVDPQDMLGHIDGLPDQLQSAWDLGRRLPLEFADGLGPSASNVRQVVISGMGGSAIGADLVSAAVMDTCPVPIFVHRDYGLPVFAKGPETLVICSSHSGNTEETLDAYETAVENGCRVLAICTGGRLAEAAKAAGIPIWQFAHEGQPRAAVGFSFGLILGALNRLGLVPDASEAIAGAVKAMKSQQVALAAESPVSQNPAKRLAGQLMGRWVTVFGAGALAPVARRWKGQINEVAKAVANFEFIPEADHNALAGVLHPAEVIPPHVITLFLRAPSDHPRNRLRLDMTRQTYMLEGMNVDGYTAKGDTPLAHIWTALHFGDYVAYYLAMAYGVDPTPVAALQNLKAALKEK
ncbi:MAG: bifunctional phosphoglucose/phosphomannose isomerase [Anaerolineales bacterium]|nr:bifunctional phosphoglucose/phosphomannose isomerase [Anaerolineales bacterium]